MHVLMFEAFGYKCTCIARMHSGEGRDGGSGGDEDELSTAPINLHTHINDMRTKSESYRNRTYKPPALMEPFGAYMKYALDRYTCVCYVCMTMYIYIVFLAKLQCVNKQSEIPNSASLYSISAI